MTIMKQGVRRAPINALSAFSWLSISSRRQQQVSLIWMGACDLYLWPHSEPGASERLLSAWSVLINIPSSRVMINANPIDCASEEKASQSEWSQAQVASPIAVSPRRLTEQQRSHPTALYQTQQRTSRGWRRSFLIDVLDWEMALSFYNQELWMEKVHQLLVQLKCKHLDIWVLEKLKYVAKDCFSFKYKKVSEATRSWERRMFWGVFSRLTDSCCTSRGRSANTPSDAQSSPLGDGPHGPGMTKLRGCLQPSLGAWPFLGHRSEVKETFPEGRPLLTLASQSLVKRLWTQNNTSALAVKITISVRLITVYIKHTWICLV